jgi:hypothetical protein
LIFDEVRANAGRRRSGGKESVFLFLSIKYK